MKKLVQHSSKSNEHYSPSFIVEPARRLFGGTIDLGPASSAIANETIRATRFFTRVDDGLTKPWSGNVWLNPPGGIDEDGSVQKAWWWRVSRAWFTGEIEQAVVVCFNLGLLQTTQLDRPDPRLPLPLDFPICLPSSRIPYDKACEFGRPAQRALFGQPTSVEPGKSPPAPSAVVYMWSSDATSPGRFKDLYAPIGRCIWTREGW